VLAVFCIFGSALWRACFGEDNTYNYFNGNLGVHFVDVGDGDCTILQLPDGKVAMIDTGSEYYYSRVKTYLTQRIKPKGNLLDYVIITHPHEDHMGGLADLQRDFHIKTLITDDNMTEGQTITGTSKSDKTLLYRIQFHAVGISEGGAANEMSPIITIEYANQVFVITGDAGHPTENVFMQTDTAKAIFGNGRADTLTTWLHVGHHGSRDSTGDDFLKFLKPKYAIISVGTLYNHPHDEVTNLLNYYDVKTMLTRDMGNIAVRCNGNTTKLFYQSDNPLDLTWLWIVLFVGTPFLCFVNYFYHKKDKILCEKALDTQHIVV